MSSTRSSSSSSTTIDDDLSLMVHDSSETTVATQTSRSWHSVRSDLPLNSHLFIRSPMINHWLARCSIEPDVRLTTAQEWKLRTCLRRFLQLCNRPLRLIWVRRRENVSISIRVTQDSPQTTLEKEFPESGQFLNIFFHLSSSTDEHPIALDVNLKTRATNIPLSKPIRFVFHVLSNLLKISLRTAESLVELSLLTRENEPIRGTFYRWNETEPNSSARQTFTIEIDE